ARHGGPAVLAATGPADLAAELLRHELGAVADTEHGHAGAVHGGIDRRGVVDVDGSRASGEHDATGAPGEHLGQRHGARDDLGVDAGLADAARDQLCVLRPEVDDENGVVLVCTQRPMPTPCARCNALPSVCSDGATITSAFWNSFSVS